MRALRHNASRSSEPRACVSITVDSARPCTLRESRSRRLLAAYSDITALVELVVVFADTDVQPTIDLRRLRQQPGVIDVTPLVITSAIAQEARKSKHAEGADKASDSTPRTWMIIANAAGAHVFERGRLMRVFGADGCCCFQAEESLALSSSWYSSGTSSGTGKDSSLPNCPMQRPTPT